MTLEKTQFVDQIEVVKNGSVQVRTKTTITENGEQISELFHRHVVIPGANYSNEDARVRAICKAVHTKDVVAEYNSKHNVES